MENKNQSIVDGLYDHVHYGKSTQVALLFENYQSNGTLALQLLSRSDSMEDNANPSFDDPYATVTVNLPASRVLATNEQFVDSNNLPKIGKWLEDNGIASPTGVKVQSGYCTYEAYAFNITSQIEKKTQELRNDYLGLHRSSGPKL